MSILYMTGFEAGTSDWYRNCTLPWTISDDVYSLPGYHHLRLNGTGSTYAIFARVGVGCNTGTVTSGSARWLHFWGRNYNTSDFISVQFCQSGTVQCQVVIQNNGVISLYRGTTLLAPSSSLACYPQVAHWYAIECTCQDVGGILNVYADGDLVASYSGDTKAHATLTDWDHFGFGGFLDVGGPGWLAACMIDDIIVTDSTTGQLKETFIDPIIPNGDAMGSLTPSVVGAHYVLVDEIPASDADYCSTETSGNSDFYDMTAPPSSSAVLAINFLARVTKDATLAQGQVGIFSGGSIVFSTPVVMATSPSYSDIQYFAELNPDTSTAWNDTSVAAVKIGVRFTT